MTEPLRDLFGIGLPAPSQRRQLQLPLAWRAPAANTRVRFLTGESNMVAARHVLGVDPWTAPATILTGPSRSGRSTLGRLFAERVGGDWFDDAESAEEESLFHAWNRAAAQGSRLLVVAGAPAWLDTIRLPDLRTRLASAPHVAFDTPDSCLTRDLVEWLLIERGHAPAPRLGSYVAARIERSYAAVHAVVAAIDSMALASGQGATIAIARAALAETGLYDRHASINSESPEPE
jgi:hypothetical protein